MLQNGIRRQPIMASSTLRQQTSYIYANKLQEVISSLILACLPFQLLIICAVCDSHVHLGTRIHDHGSNLKRILKYY